jgi:hypothetical protein
MADQESLEILIGNPDEPVDPVCNEKALSDPPPNSALRALHDVGDLSDREEFRGRFRSIGTHFAPPFPHRIQRGTRVRWRLCEVSITSPISNRRGRGFCKQSIHGAGAASDYIQISIT